MHLKSSHTLPIPVFLAGILLHLSPGACSFVLGPLVANDVSIAVAACNRHTASKGMDGE